MLAAAGLGLGARLATVGVLLYFSPWGESAGMPVVKKHSAQRQSQAIPHCTRFATAILAQKNERVQPCERACMCACGVCVYAAVGVA